MLPVMDVSVDVLLDPIDVAPELVLPEVPEVPAAPMLVLVEPEPAVGMPPVGVPVVPIGVCCVLCWPAPTGALMIAGFGGLPWAMAVPRRAKAATPASRPLMCFDAVI